MKKVNLNYKAPATKGAQVVPGVFKMSGGDVATRQNPILVLSNTPNGNVSESGGWNFVFTDTADSNKLKVSKALNPLYNANEQPSPRAEIPQYIPANYRTIDEALSAYNANLNILDA